MIFWFTSYHGGNVLPWLLLGLSAVFLEACALLFQHGLGFTATCLMCIYERLVVIGLLVSL